MLRCAHRGVKVQAGSGQTGCHAYPRDGRHFRVPDRKPDTVACEERGDGIEQDEKWFDYSCRRIEAAVRAKETADREGPPVQEGLEAA